MATESEKIIAEINTNVFFKEFTFNQTSFPAENGELELADCFVLLDDITFLIQAKERNQNATDTKENVDKWFNDRVLKKAKNQVKASLAYLERYTNIVIQNSKGHSIKIPDIDKDQIKKVVIYEPNSKNLSDNLRDRKYYKSQDVGHIHIIHLEDYYHVCSFLLTPAELNNYFAFREKMVIHHQERIDIYPEQYLLSHFLYNPDDLTIDEHYIELLPRFRNDIEDFDVSDIIEKFYDRIHDPENKLPERYYPIVKEIVKLTRHALKEFKSRFTWMVNLVNNGVDIPMPKRFGIPDTDCGFVFLPLDQVNKQHWKNAIQYHTEVFKYKHKYRSCLGVTAFKTGEYFDIQWCYINSLWEYDAVLEAEVNKQAGAYGAGETKASYYEFDSE